MHDSAQGKKLVDSQKSFKTKDLEHVFTFKVGGEAGFGVMSAGLTFAKIATRSGYNTFDYTEYPSLIRGGHNVMQVSVSANSVYSQYKHTDFLVALNQETLDLHKNELTHNSGVLYDHENNIDVSGLPDFVHRFEVPFLNIIREVDGSMIMRNSVALAASCALLGADLHHLIDILTSAFGHKHPDILDRNIAACNKGYEYAMEHYADEIRHDLKQLENPTEKLLLTGNEAIGLAAIAAGLQFAAIYPMTPTSNILHTLAPHQEKFNYVYKQPEDEIAAINMAIGAAHAGARSMVATSGGGFCLMSEAYGLAGITETPVVIIEGMRGSPATGVPTWTEQGDLRFVLHAHQGDFPRIVLAAGDIQECFDLTLKAFNLAEKYQTPVVLLGDKYNLESHQSVAPFDYSDFEIDRGKFVDEWVPEYKRYTLQEDGISPRSPVGLGNHFVANSDEHDAYGYSNEEIKNRNEQMNKRMQKLKTCADQDMEEPVLYGPKDAPITIVSWGSNKFPILEALKFMNDVNYLHITWINPFPSKSVAEVLNNAKHVINLECNYSAQLGGIIAENTGIRIKDNFLKYDGRPFYPEEIVAKIVDIKDEYFKGKGIS